MSNKFMKEAYRQAIKAMEHDEVPVGCVIVKNDKIIARAYNKKETLNLATAHAEVLAIQKASKKLQSKYLDDCDLYVTLEPCLMCAGAIVQARLRNVYYGTSDPKGGAMKSAIDLDKINVINHHPKIYQDVMVEGCSTLLKTFFKNKRNKRK